MGLHSIPWLQLRVYSWPTGVPSIAQLLSQLISTWVSVCPLPFGIFEPQLGHEVAANEKKV